MIEPGEIPPGVDPTTPSPARLYDYYLGGTHNFPAGRELAEKMKAGLPDVVDIAWANVASTGARPCGWPITVSGMGGRGPGGCGQRRVACVVMRRRPPPVTRLLSASPGEGDPLQPPAAEEAPRA